MSLPKKRAIALGVLLVTLFGAFLYLNKQSVDHASEIKARVTRELPIGSSEEIVSAYLSINKIEFGRGKNQITAIWRNIGRSSPFVSSSLAAVFYFDANDKLKRISFEEQFTGV